MGSSRILTPELKDRLIHGVEADYVADRVVRFYHQLVFHLLTFKGRVL